MAKDPTKLIANALLMFTSTMGLSITRGLKCARAAFKLFFLTSTISALSSMFDFPALQDLDEMVWVWCYCLGVPLLAVDLCMFSPYVPDISTFHLAIPLYTVIAYHVHPPHVDALLLSISHSVSILFLAVTTALDGHLCGFAFSFVHFFAMFRTDDGEKTRLNWTILSAMSNIFAIKLICNYWSQ